MSGRKPAADPAAETVVSAELGKAGGLAAGTLENYRGWVDRFTAWCELHDLVPFPVVDETAQLFVHAHYPRWRYSYVKAFPAALREGHRQRGLPAADLRGLGEYLRRLSADDKVAPAQPLVEALRVQEADRIRLAQARQPMDPRVSRVRAVLAVSAVARLPLLDLPARHLQRPDLLWAERLPASSLIPSDTEVRISVPGGETFLVDAERDPVEYAVLTAVLADPVDAAFPLAGPRGESRRLVAAAARRCGLAQAARQPLDRLQRGDRRFLLAHVDEHYQQRLRDWAYVLTGLFTACRHDELSRFMLDEITETAQGYTVWVDHTKNYPEGHDFDVRHAGPDPATCAHPLCPACALRRQRDLVRRAHGRSTGPLFATRYRGQWCVMTRQNGRRVVKGLWDRAGLPAGKRVATRALRAGGITSASEAGWERWRIADELSGHRDLNVLELYVRKLDPFFDEFFLPV